MENQNHPSLTVKGGSENKLNIIYLVFLFVPLGYLIWLKFNKLPLFHSSPEINLIMHALFFVVLPIIWIFPMATQKLDLVVPKNEILTSNTSFLKRLPYDWWHLIIFFAPTFLGAVFFTDWLMKGWQDPTYIGATPLWRVFLTMALVGLIAMFDLQYINPPVAVRITNKGLGLGLRSFLEWESIERVLIKNNTVNIYIKANPNIPYDVTPIQDAHEMAILKKELIAHCVSVVEEFEDMRTIVQSVVLIVFISLVYGGWYLHAYFSFSRLASVFFVLLAGIILQLMFDRYRGAFKIATNKVKVETEERDLQKNNVQISLGSTDIPSWATFFSVHEYHEFAELVRQRSGFLGFNAGKLNEGYLEPGEGKMGLVNLAQTCHQLPRADWPKTIEDWFGRINKGRMESDALKEKVGNFNQAKKLLAIRIWPENYMRSSTEKDPSELYFSRKDLEGTDSVLVFDLPDFVQSVRPEWAKNWQKTKEELFDIALINTLEKTKIEKSEIPISGGKLVVIAGDELLTATHVLRLDKHPECLGEKGALVGIPNSRMVMCCPIRDLGVIPATNVLIQLVQKYEAEGPQSISSNIYWYFKGQFIWLPYKSEKDKLNFYPPDSYVEMLSTLKTPKD